MYWVARLPADRAEHGENRETTLAAFASKFEGGPLLETALDASDQKDQVERLMSLLLATIDYLRSQYGELEVGGEGMLAEMARDPQRIRFWPPEIATNETKSEMLKKVVGALTTWPEMLGLILTGSFAAEYKWDEFGDLDVCCLCTTHPDAKAHASIIDAVAAASHGAFGPCDSHLYLDFGATSMHLEFVVLDDQDRYFKQLREKGTELPFINVSHEQYALSAYGWSSGKILFDPNGLMSAYRKSIDLFPDAIKNV